MVGATSGPTKKPAAKSSSNTTTANNNNNNNKKAPVVGPTKQPIPFERVSGPSDSGIAAAAASIQKRAIVTDAARAQANASPIGEYYEGEFDESGKRHGKGTLTWANGNQYKGDWVEGRMTGNALFVYGGQGGDVYEGGFMNDKKHGDGQYVFANGNTYVGTFQSDKRHGYGEYRWVCGDKYAGEWYEGKMHGQGITTYANGNQYEGGFVEDRRDGHGKLTCVDGLTFEGEWKDNMRNGFGVLTFPNGDKYEGGWLNDQKHGKGVDTFVNGNRFDGEYYQNAKTGQGKMTFANGDIYEGLWAGDTMHGKGTYKFGNGYVYEGEWQRDLRHGFGTYQYNNSVYSGEWKEDKRHGKGVLTVDNETEIYKGEWKNGKMEGKFEVTITKPVHLRYLGEWKSGQINGNGSYVFDSGAMFAGTWTDDGKKKAKSKNDVLPTPVEIKVPDVDDQAKFQNSSDQDKQHRDQLLYIEDLQRDNATLTQQLSLLQEKKEEKDRDRRRLDELERALKASESKAQLATESESQQKQSLQSLRTQLEQQEKEIVRLGGLLEEAHQQSFQFKKEAEDRYAKITENDEKVSKAIEERDNIIQTLRKQLEDKDENSTQLGGLKWQLEQSEQIISDLRKEIEDKSESLSDLKEKISLLSQQQMQITQLKTSNSEKDTIIADLKRQVNEKKMENRENEEAKYIYDKQAIRDRDHKISQLELMISGMSVENQRALKTTEESERKAMQLQTIINKLQTEKDIMDSKTIEQQKESLSLRDKLETAMEKIKSLESLLLASKNTSDNSSVDKQIIDLKHQINILNQQLDDAEKEANRNRAELQPYREVIADLKESKTDLEKELKVASQEISLLKEQLQSEKKRRKRAEKMSGGEDLSVEAYRNQVTALRSELDKKTNELNSLANQQTYNRDDYQYNKRNNSESSNDMRSSMFEQKVRDLLSKLEERDKIIQQQSQELRKVTQLESQLQSAHDRIAALSSCSEVNAIKEVTRMMSAESQMDTRYLLSLDASQRRDELRKEVMKRSSSDLTWLPTTMTKTPSSSSR